MSADSASQPGAQRWAVVGGGLMGLTMALRLAQAGRRVTLFEAADEVGGLAAAWTLGGVTWDKHYHVTLLSDGYTRGLLREVDLESGMRWVTTRTGFYAAGRVAPLSNSIDYLRLPTLGMLGKLRLAATILYAARVTDWRSLEEIPVETWLRRHSGNRTFEQLWRPLLRAKLGDGYQRASAAFIWATIQRLYAARRSGLKREMFGYAPGGYAVILARLADRLRELGVALHVGCPVRRVQRGDNGLTVASTGGEERFDGVVMTLPPAVSARLCDDLSAPERNALSAIDYQGVVCMSLLLDRPVSDCYLTYIPDEDAAITAVVDMSAFVAPDQLDGHGLVYLPRYAHRGERVFGESDDQTAARFQEALRKIYPDFHAGRVKAWRISRVPDVFPIPTLSYSRKLPPMTTRIPGLHLVTSAHIVNGTLNVNDTVRVAERAARSLIETNGARSDAPVASGEASPRE